LEKDTRILAFRSKRFIPQEIEDLGKQAYLNTQIIAIQNGQ
jgi:hypothetical protein